MVLSIAAPPPLSTRKSRSSFRIVAQSPEEENNYDYMQHRIGVKGTGLMGSVAHMVKGALGAGILGGHVAYMKAGVLFAIPLNVVFGLYMTFCLHLLVQSAQTLYKRTAIPSMSYPDVGEAACACFPNPKIARCAKCFRYMIDAIIIIDLYGSCATYQIIIAKSIKQLVENTHETSMEGKDGLPDLRIYLLAMIIPLICICLIRHLKWLAPFSLAANLIILFCIGMTIYYASLYNPTFSDLRAAPVEPQHIFEFTGMIVFAMSCAGVVLPVENNMKNPKKFPLALTIGMFLVVLCTFSVAFFGYAGFLETCESPITVNFPMKMVPKILKGLIAVMLYVTHALNFWVPFNLSFHYLKKCHSEKYLLWWELLYRALSVLLISMVAILFPSVNSLMGFIGAFCLSNMAFIWPITINLLVIWHRPGLGKLKWRLWRGILLISIGIFIWVCGSLVNGRELASVFMGST